MADYFTKFLEDALKKPVFVKVTKVNSYDTYLKQDCWINAYETLNLSDADLIAALQTISPKHYKYWVIEHILNNIKDQSIHDKMYEKYAWWRDGFIAPNDPDIIPIVVTMKVEMPTNPTSGELQWLCL